MFLHWLNLWQFQTIVRSSVSVVLRPMYKFSFERSLLKSLALSVLGRKVSRLAENISIYPNCFRVLLKVRTDLRWWSTIVQGRAYHVFPHLVAVPRDSLCLGGWKSIRECLLKLLENLSWFF